MNGMAGGAFHETISGHQVEKRWEGNKNPSLETSDVTVESAPVVGMTMGSSCGEESA